MSGNRWTVVRSVKYLRRPRGGQGGEFGRCTHFQERRRHFQSTAVAARIEEALARAVARSPRAFRAIIEAAHGENTARIRLEEHLPGGGSRPRETPLDLTLDPVGLRRTIDALVA